MSRNDAAGGRFSRSVMDNNKLVFLLSLLIAVICWATVSIVNMQEVEKEFTKVKIQLVQPEEWVDKYGLSVYDVKESDLLADVKVKGYSYLLRDLDNIDGALTASCESAVTPGTFPLEVMCSLPANIKLVSKSVDSIEVYFDTEEEKMFSITEDIVELPGYALADGFVRENPILSPDTVTISGASRDIGRITAVKARVELDKTLNSGQRLQAKLIVESEAGVMDINKFTIKPEGKFYITIPVNHIGTYDAVVDFANVPQSYKENGIDYTVTPPTVNMTQPAGDSATQRSKTIPVGKVDFSDIAPEKVNTIPLTFDAGNGGITYEVEIDATGFVGRSMTIPVDTSNITLPSNVRVTSSEVADVTIAGPEASVSALETTSVYAVPVLDGLGTLTPGQQSVPAKIVFRTATDCWAYGKYTVDITVQ